MGIVCRVFSGTTGINVMNYHHILIAKFFVVDLLCNVTFFNLIAFYHKKRYPDLSTNVEDEIAKYKV